MRSFDFEFFNMSSDEKTKRWLKNLWMDEKTMQWIPGGHMSSQKGEEKLQKALQFNRPYGYQIIKKEGENIGYVVLRPFTWNQNFLGKTEIGYIIDQKFWGKHMGSEAVRRVVQYAQNNFDSLFAFVHLENLASIRLLEKIGFQMLHEISKNYPNARIWKQTFSNHS